MGCGEVPTCKMRGKLWGFTPHFTYTNAPRPHDNCEAGDKWAWDNMRYVMKRQL